MPLTADRAVVRAILQADRPWAVYALADLAAEYQAVAEWHTTVNRSAVLLLFRGFQPPVLFAQGNGAELALLLPEITGEREFYLSVRAETVDLLRPRYRIHNEKRMWRLQLDASTWKERRQNAEALGPPNFAELSTLYADGTASGESPPFFNAAMLDRGVYFGIREAGSLVAAAGTHIVNTEESVAAIGNVYTRRDRRGSGYASQVTAAVAGCLLQAGIQTIALNVTQDNAPALSIYQRLGFKPHCDYREGLAVSGPDVPAR